MADTFEQKLAKYADVIVHVGLNLQPGQRLLLGMPIFGVDGTPVEASRLVRHIARAAYAAGARYMAVNWDDMELQRIRVEHAPAGSMDEFPTWKNEAAIAYIDQGDALAVIISQDPDLLSGLDPQKIQAKQKVEAGHFHRVFSKMAAGETNWLAFGASVPGWATAVFPDLSATEAVDRLWEAIFAACRIDQADPLAAWERHIAELARRAAYLTAKQYTALTYTAPGTDLTVGLPAGHIWNSGRLETQHGLGFVANLPTEEVFTMPHRERVDGQVAATMPLSYAGSLIENFSLTFAHGQVVEATAASGQEALDNLLATDDASRYLGEVALVPHSSPISQTGLLFYNVLFDENASNHLALGNAYRFSMEGGDQMSSEEFAAAGGNESMTHADFMIGSGQMDVHGVTSDGTAEPLLRDGEWAFTV